MRIALIQPPSPWLLSSAVHPPLGLWYLGAALSADDLVAARDYLEARFKPRKEAA